LTNGFGSAGLREKLERCRKRSLVKSADREPKPM
jgi:hypothetical protein